jgi:hypothetical protein
MERLDRRAANLDEREAQLAAAPEGGQELGAFYENCDVARAAGAAPVYEGDPGYGPHLDANRDGVGCE